MKASGADGSRVAVVTGGGRGIGRGIVLELAAAGFSTVVNYRANAEAALDCRRQAEALGAPRALAIQADAADVHDGRRLVAEVLDEFGRIDVWVNNAGVAPESRVDLLDTTPESWDRVTSTNLRGPFFLTQTVARRMLELVEREVVASPQIIFITSISSNTASVERGEYCAAKAGLSMVAQLFAVRLAGLGIHVHEVRPGVIETDMTRRFMTRTRLGSPRACRRSAAGELPPTSARRSPRWHPGAFPFSTGQILNVDGGLNLRRL